MVQSASRLVPDHTRTTSTHNIHAPTHTLVKGVYDQGMSRYQQQPHSLAPSQGSSQIRHDYPVSTNSVVKIYGGVKPSQSGQNLQQSVHPMLTESIRVPDFSKKKEPAHMIVQQK